jgi:hypothetical protein
MATDACSACEQPLDPDYARVWWTGLLAIQFCQTCAADPALIKTAAARANARFLWKRRR